MAHLKSALIALVAILSLTTAGAAQRAVPGTGGSLPLAEVMTAAARYPNLLHQIRLQLLLAGRKKSQVVCTAERFSNRWEHLGGARVGTYECRIGGRALRITTLKAYYDRNGHRLDDDDPATTAKAARVVESGFKWAWR